MHSLVIDAAVVLMGIWVLLLPLRVGIGLRRGLLARARSLPTERVSDVLGAPVDDVECS